MKSKEIFSRLELKMGSCLENYKYFRSKLLTTTKLLVLVKANAYGHGAVQFATMMQDAGADYLAIALPVEGIELRKSGIRVPILVLTTGTDSFEDIINYSLEPGIPNLDTLEALCSLLKAKGIKNYPIHIKLDSGMHRLGFMPSEIPALNDYLKDCPWVRVVSVYSHLSCAEDKSADDFTMGQIERFTCAASSIEKSLGYKPMRHILNSAGIERWSKYQFDMVRLGIGIYGVSAVSGIELSPVASFKCKILQIKELAPSDGAIGYGRKGAIGQMPKRIATIPVGYADGLDRRLGCGNASFSLNGHRVPTIGNICMDMCMLDITGIDAAVGDTVTIFGEDPRVEELSGILGTIPYEILTRIPRRIERIVVK